MKARHKHSINASRHGSRHGTTNGAANGAKHATVNGTAQAALPAPAEVAVLDAPPPSQVVPVSETPPTAGPAPVTGVASAVITAPTADAPPARQPQPQGETAPEGETPPETEPIYPHRQSQALRDMLVKYQQMRNGIDTADDAFRLLMPNYGLTPAFFIAGDSLYEVAGDSITTRLLAVSAALEATERQAAAERLARTSYVTFRRMARTVIKAGSARVALALDEAIPFSVADFAHSAAVVLPIAATEPYATQLALATFDADRLAETTTAVQILAAAINQREAAAAAARRSTEARNAAFADLRTHIHQLRVAVYAMLRLNPHLSTPAGF